MKILLMGHKTWKIKLVLNWEQVSLRSSPHFSLVFSQGAICEALPLSLIKFIKDEITSV